MPSHRYPACIVAWRHVPSRQRQWGALAGQAAASTYPVARSVAGPATGREAKAPESAACPGSSKHLRSRFHSSRHRNPSGPARRRSNSRSKALGPINLSPKGSIEGAEAIRQRVSAALGAGCASSLRSSAITPDPSAARASRRLAVRSRTEGLPQHSITTAASPAQRNASDAARKSIVSSCITPSNSIAGSKPSAAKPGPYRCPPIFSALFVRSQSIGSPPCPASKPSNKAKPAELPESSTFAPNSSCSRPFTSPPPSAASSAAWPLASIAGMSAVRPRSNVAMWPRRNARIEDESAARMFMICSSVVLLLNLSRRACEDCILKGLLHLGDAGGQWAATVPHWSTFHSNGLFRIKHLPECPLI